MKPCALSKPAQSKWNEDLAEFKIYFHAKPTPGIETPRNAIFTSELPKGTLFAEIAAETCWKLEGT